LRRFKVFFLPVKFLFLVVVLAMGAGNARSAGRDIYPDPSQAKADLAAALKTAAAAHKRILLDFGGNWCPDCVVLDSYFHDPANRPILEANFVLVHVNIGMMAAQGRARARRAERTGQAAL
jgi:thiol:disulfide interchange protein